MLPQLIIILFNISFITFAYFASVNPCISCKHFLPHNRGIDDLGLCIIFKGNFAQHCRNDKNLCGKTGFLYEAKNDKNINHKYILEQHNETPELDISHIYDELNNRCSGEVNEKEELEQLEKDFAEMYEKIKKHNKNIRRPFYSLK